MHEVQPPENVHRLRTFVGGFGVGVLISAAASAAEPVQIQDGPTGQYQTSTHSPYARRQRY